MGCADSDARGGVRPQHPDGHGAGPADDASAGDAEEDDVPVLRLGAEGVSGVGVWSASRQSHVSSAVAVRPVTLSEASRFSRAEEAGFGVRTALKVWVSR